MNTRIAAAATSRALALLLCIAALSAAPGKPPARPEDRAARAAVAATRGGKAVKVARDAERGAAWEVEVLMPGGRRLDVLLDARFRALHVSDEAEPYETPAGRKALGSDAKRAENARQTQLAARAAAKAVGGGILIDADRDTERGATWEVEFMKLDGKRISVLLDSRYKVIRVTRGKQAN